MAERRMFAKSIIGSARFLRMPPTSRLLYYDLGMQADDDGVVEAFSVMRTTGATEDDLKVLASKGFVQVLNEDLVTYITDWSRNNYIQKDRYHPSVYTELLVKLGDGERAGTACIRDGSEMYTDCIQTVSKMDTQVRLGEGEVYAVNMQSVVEGIVRRAEQEPQEGDYEQDGLLYCGKCHTRKQTVVELLGRKRIVGVMCACRTAAYEQEQLRWKREQRFHKVIARLEPFSIKLRCDPPPCPSVRDAVSAQLGQDV